MFKDYADARGAASRAMFRQDLETIRAAFEQFPDLKNEDRAFPWVIDAVNQGKRANSGIAGEPRLRHQ